MAAGLARLNLRRASHREYRRTVDDHLPRRARIAFPGAGDDARGRVDRVPRRVLASWQRSEEYGVSLESVDPVFSGTVDEESLFFQCGQEVLTGLAFSLAAEPISMMLTDADGRVLNRLSGDASLLRSLDSVHLATGFSYAEREAGTNGVGLALADRTPTLVRAEEHYALSLRTYTCAAVPVLDPVSGRLEGSVNLTTWSRSSSDLLLALARSAASNTAALMLARSTGRRPRPTPRGEVFRVEAPRLEPASGTEAALSAEWTVALRRAREAMAAGRTVLAVGERGTGRSTLLAQAERREAPSARILAASPPGAEDVEAWLSLWAPEVGKPHTAVVVRRVDALPLWAAQRLCAVLSSPSVGGPVAFTAERYDDVPAPLAALVGTVVHVPPLRERPDDVLTLARHLALRARGREIGLTPAAEHVLLNHAWPGNVTELARVVRRAATHADIVDLHDLPATLLSGSSRRLSRIETFERDEIIRVVTRDGVTMRDAAEELGMSRATLYRKLAHYDVHLPH